MTFTIISCEGQDKRKTFEVKDYSSYSSSIIPSKIEISIEDIKYDNIFNEIYLVASGNSNPDIFFWETWYDDIAFSVIDKNGRYIFYNRAKFDSLVIKTGTVQGVRSIIAHELSHLLNNHPLRYTPSSLIFEKEADYYSGKILRKFKASLEESVDAINYYGNDFETDTHPGKSARTKEIKKGWINESFSLFMDYMIEFDSLLYETAYITIVDDSTLSNRFHTFYSDYITSREKFIEAIDSLGINAEKIQSYVALSDTLSLNFEIASFDKMQKENKSIQYELFQFDEKINEAYNAQVENKNVSFAVIYDIPILIIEGEIYNNKMEKMGNVHYGREGNKYQLSLNNGREYNVNSLNEIIAVFPDGSKSKVGKISN